MAILLAGAIHFQLHAKDVFQPPKPPGIEVWSAKTDVNRDAIGFQSAAGSQIRGWFYRADRQNAPYVLFFYGSNEDLAHESPRLAWLRDTFHVNAVGFDYPGYGFSAGAIDARNIRSAAVEEFDFIHSHVTPQGAPIVVYGWSIGAGLAIRVASQRAAAGLILQAPPASADEMLKWSSRHEAPWYARGTVSITADADVRQLYEGADAIAAVDCPLLIIQGEQDDVVPIAQGREVFAASPAKQKRFVNIPGAHHNDLHFRDPPASDAVSEFLSSYRR